VRSLPAGHRRRCIERCTGHWVRQGGGSRLQMSVIMLVFLRTIV